MGSYPTSCWFIRWYGSQHLKNLWSDKNKGDDDKRGRCCPAGLRFNSGTCNFNDFPINPGEDHYLGESLLSECCLEHGWKQRLYFDRFSARKTFCKDWVWKSKIDNTKNPRSGVNSTCPVISSKPYSASICVLENRYNGSQNWILYVYPRHSLLICRLLGTCKKDVWS